ncbi:BMP family protein [Chloracidobacterium thermophilum]|jgi:basic membrane protein A|uniref:BMP family lipoprotein n=1 Tax=Chloracidobacterium thermophilum TaxID=458033 RepID=UPI000738A729|nr:BMP family ABC transporter substrate-binding protein [Chloracidobacterium thermophilum]
MMQRVRWSVLLLTALVWGAALGCGHVPRDEEGKLRVGLVFDIGGKDDKSFNAAAWEGAKRASQELPIVLRHAEPGEPNNLEPCMRAFAERGYDLIIGIGFAQGPVLATVAKEYPNLHFAIVDSVVDLPNVASLVFKEHEGSFLVGMMAARASRTGKIGFVGGMDIPLIRKFATGYEEGARYVNPNITVLKNFVGITDAAWNNPGKGKELAKAQYEAGADVIFQAAGNSGIGVFDAAEENRKLAIGVDANQNWVKPGFILTSMVKRVDVAVYTIIKETLEKRFRGGIHAYGLENEGIAYALDDYNRPLVSEDTLREVEAARQKIIRGDIQVTDYMANLK